MRMLLLSMLALLIGASHVAGEARCRLYRPADKAVEGPRLDERDLHYTLHEGESPAIFTVAPEPSGATTAFKGHVCDCDGDPIPHLKVDLVRFEGDISLTEPPVEKDFEEGGGFESVETQPLQSTDTGGLSATGLGPGKWALRVDWPAVSSTNPKCVVIDLRRAPGVELGPVYGSLDEQASGAGE